MRSKQERHFGLVRGETPRLCRGGSRSLTDTGVHRGDSWEVSRQSTRKGVRDGRRRKRKPYQVGVQIPCCVHSQMPQKSAVRGIAAALGRGVPQAGRAEESRIEEGHARPRAHDDRDTAQVCGVARDWVYQREERNPSGSGVWGEKEELCGAALLARGYYVSTVGRDETVIREYIRQQEAEDKRLDQINLWR